DGQQYVGAAAAGHPPRGVGQACRYVLADLPDPADDEIAQPPGHLVAEVLGRAAGDQQDPPGTQPGHLGGQPLTRADAEDDALRSRLVGKRLHRAHLSRRGRHYPVTTLEPPVAVSRPLGGSHPVARSRRRVNAALWPGRPERAGYRPAARFASSWAPTRSSGGASGTSSSNRPITGIRRASPTRATMARAKTAYIRPMPRPGPVPMTAPTVPASGPPGASSGSNNLAPYGAITANPSGSVDQAISVLIANTRPWKRCGTFTWMIVV